MTTNNQIFRVYIAAPFFTPDQLRIVMNIENALTMAQIPFFSPRLAGVLKDMSKEEQKKTKKEIYDGNIREMNACSHMVAAVQYKDTGTHFEIGYYAAMGSPIVLFSEEIGTVNVMLAEAAIAICDQYSKIEQALYGEYSVEINSLT